MNPKEFVSLGLGLSQEWEEEANKIHCRDDSHDEELWVAEGIRIKAKDVQTLLSNPEVVQKLENSTLLSQARKVPYLASLEERVEQFEQLYEAFVDFAQAKEHWEAHFAANRQKYIEIWEKPKRWEKEYQEQQRIRAEEAERRFTENLAFAEEKYSKPAQKAPCFAETRRNGLNCNRSDLVEIKKLPTVFSADQKIEISIKKCIQCWQIYKEYFVVDSSTRQFRSRFLKPDEADAEQGFYFSNPEAEEYNKTDLGFLINPNLKTAETTPGTGVDVTKKMSRTVYEESGILQNHEKGENVEICSLCVTLPDDLTVNTGREKHFPDAFYRLTKIGYSNTHEFPFRRCPKCGTNFYWIDLSSWTGTGSNDEERLIRLSARASRLLDKLFSADPKDHPDPNDVGEYFETFPLDQLLTALRTRAYTAANVLAPFVPNLVRLLEKDNDDDSTIAGMLCRYISDKPERAQEILEAFRSTNRGPGHYRLTDVLHYCLTVVAKKN